MWVSIPLIYIYSINPWRMKKQQQLTLFNPDRCNRQHLNLVQCRGRPRNRRRQSSNSSTVIPLVPRPQLCGGKQEQKQAHRRQPTSLKHQRSTLHYIQPAILATRHRSGRPTYGDYDDSHLEWIGGEPDEQPRRSESDTRWHILSGGECPKNVLCFRGSEIVSGWPGS